MKTLFAFLKKEMTEQLRTGRILFLGILFILFGIMNPAVAKLTPWLMEQMADSLSDLGMNVTEVTVTAMDSWVQFFKNIPMALIAFVLLESSIFTKEYRSGTLILSLTKGLTRYKVVAAKTAVLTLLWTAGYWLCYAVTYAYNAYFWDNAIAQNLTFSAVVWWVFGLWVIALSVLFSTLCTANTGVLVGTGGVVLVSSLVGMIPRASKFLPTLLMDGNSLIYGQKSPEDYTAALLITALTAVAALAVGFVRFNKKQL